MSLQYRLDKDDRDDPRAPWRLYKTGGKHKDKWLPERTQLEPFPKWTAQYDRHGHRLLRASSDFLGLNHAPLTHTLFPTHF